MIAEEMRDQLAPGLRIEMPKRTTPIRGTHASISKANDLIGYEPTTTVREGGKNFIEWYRADRD